MHELTRLKLSIQHALIGTIPICIYCVSTNILDNCIKLICYTEVEVDENLTEDIADFDEKYTINTEIVTYPRNQFHATNEIVVFLQKQA